MKKVLVVLMLGILKLSLQAMDVIEVDCSKPIIEKLFSRTYGGTAISIVHNAITDFDKIADVLLLGSKKQLRLRDEMYDFSCGDIRRCSDNSIYTKLKIEPAPYLVRSRKMESTVLLVGGPQECPFRDIEVRNAHKRLSQELLADCYSKSLNNIAKVKEFFVDPSARTIAIAPFGKGNTFSHEEVADIMVKSIMKFVESNPAAYSLIYIVVNNDVIARFYRQLLEKNDKCDDGKK